MEFYSEKELIQKNGRPRFGHYQSPLQKLNVEDYRPYGKTNSTALHRFLLNSFRFKRWQYLGVTAEDAVFGLGIVHTGYLGNMFTYLFDRKLNKITEFNIIRPFASGISFTGNSVNGIVNFSARHTNALINLGETSVILDAQIKDGIKVRLTFTRIEEPLSVVTRAGLKGFCYTHKESGLSVAGNISLPDGRNFEIKPDNPSGVFDYSCGFTERITFWNWASGSGLGRKGERIGFNFSQGIHETGFSESAFWINGKKIHTGLLDFQYDDLHLLSPWRIVSQDEKVDLTFHPEGSRLSRLNYGILSSRFEQPFGRFTGRLTDGRKDILLENVSGFTEEHESKW